jgi:arylsulfatase A-like enzyme
MQTAPSCLQFNARLFACFMFAPLLATAEPSRPNFLWISCEDTSPWLGFCGEPYATTPNLDRLAREGVYYTHAFATAPVCSPCRFSIITNRYATSEGTQRLRSQFAVADSVRAFPAHLRAAGYHCTNNVKTDYNTSAEKRFIAEAWHESSARAHWRGRQPGQPFFAVFNLTETHQSQAFGTQPIPGLVASEYHDPARAPLPPYYPDTPEARRTIARVHDNITAMDKRAGRILAELEQDGLAGETIVFFWPDHGQGIPRGKRTLWDTGLRVPLVIRFPEKYRDLAPSAPGATNDRLVTLMDLGPTLLSLANLPIPPDLHGQAFLGPRAATPRRQVFGARDRVDEAEDLIRSVRDSRYLYVRNYRPDLSSNQPEGFSDQLPLRREIIRLAAAGGLTAAQLTYAGPRKPREALYDSTSDPWQLRNLAEDPAHQPALIRLREALRMWQHETRDLGFLPEWQAEQLAATGRPIRAAASSDAAYPLERVLATASLVGLPGAERDLASRLRDADPSVRTWAAIGLRAAGDGARFARTELEQALADRAIPVRLEAAGALVALFAHRPALDLLARSLQDPTPSAALHAARTLQLLGEAARPVAPALQSALAAKPDLFVTFALEGALRSLGILSPQSASSRAP